MAEATNVQQKRFIVQFNRAYQTYQPGERAVFPEHAANWLASNPAESPKIASVVEQCTRNDSGAVAMLLGGPLDAKDALTADAFKAAAESRRNK